MEPGARVGPFILVERIARSVDLETWRARDAHGGALVELRLFPGAVAAPTPADHARREAALDRLRLAGPPFLQEVGRGLDAAPPWMAHELRPAALPLERAWAGKPLETRVGWIRDVGRALGGLHGQGLAHGGVGLTTVLIEREAALITALGATHVLAPREPAARDDVRALGALLDAALSDASWVAAPDDPGGRMLDQVCRRAIGSSRDGALRTGDELAAALDACLADAAPGGPLRRHVGRYEVRDRLGRGAMGTVLRAWDPELGREVAIKLLDDPGPRGRLRFAREAQATARVRHPNVVSVHGTGVEQGRPFIVMELVQGESLDRRLQRGRLEPLDAAARIARLARGVAACHAQGIVHRDIKPANVLVEASGELRLADLGLALVADEARMTATGHVVGTLAYMAPEQHETSDVDARADVWALGALLLEALTGRHPFPADDMHALVAAKHQVRPPSEVEPGLPLALDVVTRGCLAWRRDDRYPRAEDVAADLERIASGAPPLGALAAGARPHGRLVPLLAALAATSVVVVLAAVAVATARRPAPTAIDPGPALADVEARAQSAAVVSALEPPATADAPGDPRAAELAAWRELILLARGDPASDRTSASGGPASGDPASGTSGGPASGDPASGTTSGGPASGTTSGGPASGDPASGGPTSDRATSGGATSGGATSGRAALALEAVRGARAGRPAGEVLLELDGALAAGLRAPAVARWALGLLAERGPPAPDDAASAARRLPALLVRAGVPRDAPEVVGLEAALLLAAGRPDEAAPRLGPLAARWPWAGLAVVWTDTLRRAGQELDREDLAGLRAVLDERAAPPGASWPDARRLAERILRRLEQTLADRETVKARQVEAAELIDLHVRLAPEVALPPRVHAAVLDGLTAGLRLGPELAFAAVRAWPDDLELGLAALERWARAGSDADLAGFEVMARGLLPRVAPGQRAGVGIVLGQCLARRRRWAELEPVAEQVLRDVERTDDRTADEQRAFGLVLRARARHARGDLEGAVADLAPARAPLAARGRLEELLLVELPILDDAGLGRESFDRALDLLATDGWLLEHDAVADAVWKVGAAHAWWDDLRRCYVDLMTDARVPPRIELRRAYLLLRAGDVERGMAALGRAGAVELDLAALRARDRATLERLLELAR